MMASFTVQVNMDALLLLCCKLFSTAQEHLKGKERSDEQKGETFPFNFSIYRAEASEQYQ